MKASSSSQPSPQPGRHRAGRKPGSHAFLGLPGGLCEQPLGHGLGICGLRAYRLVHAYDAPVILTRPPSTAPAASAWAAVRRQHVGPRLQ